MTVKIKNNRLIYLGIFVLLFICELLIARFFFPISSGHTSEMCLLLFCFGAS